MEVSGEWLYHQCRVRWAYLYGDFCDSECGWDCGHDSTGWWHRREPDWAGQWRSYLSNGLHRYYFQCWSLSVRLCLDRLWDYDYLSQHRHSQCVYYLYIIFKLCGVAQ